VVLAVTACPSRPSGGDGKSGGKDDWDEEPEAPAWTKKKAPPTRPIEQERLVRALEAEVAELKHTIASGQKPSTFPGLINAHEHLRELKDLERYLPAARA